MNRYRTTSIALLHGLGRLPNAHPRCFSAAVSTAIAALILGAVIAAPGKTRQYHSTQWASIANAAQVAIQGKRLFVRLYFIAGLDVRRTSASPLSSQQSRSATGAKWNRGKAMPVASSPSQKSFFLVASRNMPDAVFQQSVILMLPPNEPPLVAGIIINKPTRVTLNMLFKQRLPPARRDEKVYLGGPVDVTNPLLLIRASQPPKRATDLGNHVFAITYPDDISEILQDPRHTETMRLFLGRAQWAQEQLRGELLEGAWTVLPVRSDLLFDQDSAKVWPILSQHEHVREITAHSGESALPINHAAPLLQ
jgi:putative AlgH/UPF0301 family transcriptional regulator